jgi:hypothetical protein
MNSDKGAGNQGEEEGKVDKSLRRVKPIGRNPAEPTSPADSLGTDSEDET